MSLDGITDFRGGGSAHTDKMLGSMQPCVVVIGQRLLVPRSHGNPASACSQGAEAHGDPAHSGGREARACGMPVCMFTCMCRDAFGCTCMCMCKRMTACPCVSTSTCTQE